MTTSSLDAEIVSPSGNLDEDHQDYYNPKMLLPSNIRKFPPTVTRGWLFPDAGIETVNIMKPLHKDVISRMTKGKIKGKKMRALVKQRAELMNGKPELISRVNKHFVITHIGLSLRSRRDLNEKQMDSILRVATEVMLHPKLNRGGAKGHLQFRMSSGHFFIAEWNQEEQRFFIQTGAVIPIMYGGSAPWFPMT